MHRQLFQFTAILPVMLFAMTLGAIDVLADNSSLTSNSTKATHSAVAIWQFPQNPSPAASSNELGLKYENESKYAEAESAFRRSLSILEKTPGLDPDDLVAPLNGLGRVCEHNQLYSEAERLFRRSVSVQQSSPIHSHDEMLAMSLDWLGGALCKEHKYSEAEAVYKQSLSSREETYGKDSDMVQHCLKQLYEVAIAQKKFKDAESASERILATEKKRLGPVFGPFYIQQMKRDTAGECILPLAPAFGPGSRFDEKRFTQVMKQKLGEGSALWYKIPDWLAGLWGEIPPNVRVAELNGEVWDDPQPSTMACSGPGPYAYRKGYFKTRDGWWHFNLNISSDGWGCGGTSGSTLLDYTYYRTHMPATENDGSVCFRRSTVHFQVKPDKVRHGDELSIVPGTITTVWQEDYDEVFKKFPDDDVFKEFPDDKVAMLSTSRIYGWDGKQLSAAPGGTDRLFFGCVSWQKKAGPASRTPEQYRMQSLKEFLTQHKMFDELRIVETLN